MNVTNKKGPTFYVSNMSSFWQVIFILGSGSFSFTILRSFPKFNGAALKIQLPNVSLLLPVLNDRQIHEFR